MEILLVTLTTMSVLTLIGGAYLASDMMHLRREMYLAKAEMTAERDALKESAQKLSEQSHEIGLAWKDTNDKLETLSTKVMAIQTNLQGLSGPGTMGRGLR
jgi:hypothetical protein